MMWKPIPNYGGKYEASRDGRIRSITRKYDFIPKELKLHTKENGYLSVGLRMNGKSETKLVHRLVAATFIGESDIDVNHKDLNRKNNCVENLEYISRRENMNHCFSINKKKRLPGVSKSPHHNYYRMHAYINGKRFYKGMFKTEEDAHAAYVKFIKGETKYAER